MDLVTALALSIGLLGGVATYLYLSDPLVLGLQIWAAFIAWASFYHCGGKVQGFIVEHPRQPVGRAVGRADAASRSPISISDWRRRSGPASASRSASRLMILGCKIPIFSAIPATVYGYAATVALALLTNAVAGLMEPTLINPAVIIALSMIGGAIFGLISEALAGALARS